jgi:hypothetical protein
METIAVTKSQAAALEAAAKRRANKPHTKGNFMDYFARFRTNEETSAVLKNLQLVRVVRGLRKAAGIVPKTHGKVNFAPATMLQRLYPRGVASFGPQRVPQMERLHNSTKLDMLRLREYKAAEAAKKSLRVLNKDGRKLQAMQDHRTAIMNNPRLQNPFENELKATNKVTSLLEDNVIRSYRQRNRAKAKKIATERQRDRHDINQRIATRRVL